MLRLFAVLLVAFALTGCVTGTGDPDSRLGSLSTWQLRGKMGIRSDGGNANLSFVWNESPGRYDISLKGTLGVAIATVTGTGNQVVLTLPDGRFYRSNRVENLIEDHVGYRLPVSLLRYWVRGLPDPDYEVQPREEGFSQQGWQVTFQQFSTAGPRKILIEQDDIRLKLAALEWAY
jgi:outer membrane lipoprotein LolB